MSIDRIVMAFAGIVILTSVILSQLHSVYWLYLTGFCPLASILKVFGAKPGQAFS